MSTDWIPLAEGEYRVERAILLGADPSAVELERPLLRVHTGRAGVRYMNGRAFVRNTLVVALLEECDDLDLAIDLGGEFKFLLRAPEINAGKVFSPHIKSVLHFMPQKPWEQIDPQTFGRMLEQLRFLSPGS